MIRAYLGLGSNLKNPQRQLRQALSSIKAMPQTRLISCAEFMFNKAWGRKLQPNFYNTVVAIDTRLPPLVLLRHCQHIEKKQRRARRGKWGARTIDVDILLYSDHTLNLPQLTLPHPYIMQREFVYKPLNELAPSLSVFNSL